MTDLFGVQSARSRQDMERFPFFTGVAFNPYPRKEPLSSSLIEVEALIICCTWI